MPSPTTKQPHYRDFSLDFSRHPVTGDLVTKNDASAILQSIKNLVLTSYGEILMEPNIYGGVGELLFSLNNNLQLNTLRKKITETITNHEPRVELEKVVVGSTDIHTISVYVEFYILNQPDPIKDVIHLNRLR